MENDSVAGWNPWTMMMRYWGMPVEDAYGNKVTEPLSQGEIDELVAYEIEQARKRAEAEARRKREAELAAQQKNKGAKGKSEKSKSEKAKSEKAPSKWLTTEDRQLNGNLEQNPGY